MTSGTLIEENDFSAEHGFTCPPRAGLILRMYRGVEQRSQLGEEWSCQKHEQSLGPSWSHYLSQRTRVPGISHSPDWLHNIAPFLNIVDQIAFEFADHMNRLVDVEGFSRIASSFDTGGRIPSDLLLTVLNSMQEEQTDPFELLIDLRLQSVPELLEEIPKLGKLRHSKELKERLNFLWDESKEDEEDDELHVESVQGTIRFLSVEAKLAMPSITATPDGNLMLQWTLPNQGQFVVQVVSADQGRYVILKPNGARNYGFDLLDQIWRLAKTSGVSEWCIE